jgi:DNA (cytosine-5)-methyltransferase 1
VDERAIAFSYPRHFDRTLLTSSLRTVHTPASRRRFAATNHGESEPISRFLKLDPEGLCNTLRAGTASDRGAFTSPRPIHPHANRCITVREAARLHSYPDWFRFHVTKWHGFRQVGNSVPPRLAEAVARELLKAMSINPRRPTDVVQLGGEKLLSVSMREAADYFGVPATVIPKRNRAATGRATANA